MILSRCWRCSLVWGVLSALVTGRAEAQVVGGGSGTTTPTSTTPDPSQTLAATTSGPSDILQPSTSTSGATVTPSPFDSSWGIPTNLTIDVPASFSYQLLDESQNVNLTLCKTNATDGTLPQLNQLYVVQSLPDCFGYVKPFEGPSCSALASLGSTVAVLYTFEQVNPPAEDLRNFFFCFGNAPTDTNTVVCESYSPYFDINPPLENTSLDGTKAIARVVARQPERLSTIMTVTQTTLAVSISGAPINSPSITASLVPTSAQVSSTITASSTASATPTVTSSISIAKSSSHGLSVGAKVGIALGALILAFLLLLLALFFLRRKHAQRNDGVLPNHHSIHTDSFPHTALMTEKDDASPSTVIPILNPNQNTNLNQNQYFIHHHPNPNTYTAVPNLSSLSTSPPPTYPSTVPKRKPTANTVASTISRGLSTISRSSGPSNHPSPNIGTASNRNFESYRDAAPTYGDARHSPQVFTSAQALREEGMTAEEVARLEEEERRIDAAIAEAEGR